jgi:hypothetical protein
MSTRAVRTEIALQNLDPRLPHNKVDKKGRLVPHGASTASEPVIVTEATVEEPKVKNALVQLESEQAEQTKTEVVEQLESKLDAVEAEETEAPKKKPGKKEKKVVSTDP